MSLPLMIVGAGGHAGVVTDALLEAGERVLGFTDIDASRHGATLCGIRVVGDDRALEAHTPATVALVNGIGGIGDRRGYELRRRVQERLESQGWRFVSVRHPAAVVSTHARIGAGCHLLAACVVQANARIGDACIVNTAAVVEHDVVLGDWSHVAPGALLCGAVNVGDGCHVGAGAVVRQGIALGAGTIVGAGAVVVSDHAGGTIFGVPARRHDGGRR